MQEVLSPTPEGEYAGKAEVKTIFEIGKVGKVAGCACTDGDIVKAGNVRVLRGAKVSELTVRSHSMCPVAPHSLLLLPSVSRRTPPFTHYQFKIR